MTERLGEIALVSNCMAGIATGRLLIAEALCLLWGDET